MDENKTFYFFIENEFVCRPNLNLQDQLIGDQNYSAYAITVNLIEFNCSGETKVYKIYSNFTEIGLQEDDMEEFYKQIYQYVKANFICDDEKKIFLGCVRDDNSTHTNLNFENLGFYHRTDPIHDIFNVLKNIYIGNNLNFVDNDSNLDSSLHFVDLKNFISKLIKSEKIIDNALPAVGYFNPKRLPARERARRIWIPDQDYKLEGFIEPLKYLFSINYYEKILDEVEDGSEDLDVKHLLNFIILMKKIWKFQSVTVNDENISDYQQFLTELSKYEFYNGYIRCLNSLKHSIESNIEFFNEHKTPFVPIIFSTQMIEAEKGNLRYQSCNATPTIDECVNWFTKAFNGEINEVGISEFGKCALKFDERPEQISPMVTQGIEALTIDMENMGAI